MMGSLEARGSRLPSFSRGTCVLDALPSLPKPPFAYCHFYACACAMEASIYGVESAVSKIGGQMVRFSSQMSAMAECGRVTVRVRGHYMTHATGTAASVGHCCAFRWGQPYHD